MTDIDWTQLEADRAAGTKGTWMKFKCRCGDKNCNQYTMSSQGSVGFDETDASRMERLDALEAYALRARRVEAAADELARASQALADLRDNTSPFGGEIQQDRIERTQERFLLALAAYQAAKGGDA
jgi:hypothetical protein